LPVALPEAVGLLDAVPFDFEEEQATAAIAMESTSAPATTRECVARIYILPPIRTGTKKVIEDRAVCQG
jgi:hypothetical protein